MVAEVFSQDKPLVAVALVAVALLFPLEVLILVAAEAAVVLDMVMEVLVVLE